MTETGGRIWKQTTFHPFALTARYARGQVLRLAVDAPETATARFGDVPSLDGVATYDVETGEVAVFVVNRSPAMPQELTMALRGLSGLRLLDAVTVANPDHRWSATADDEPRWGRG